MVQQSYLLGEVPMAACISPKQETGESTDLPPVSIDEQFQGPLLSLYKPCMGQAALQIEDCPLESRPCGHLRSGASSQWNGPIIVPAHSFALSLSTSEGPHWVQRSV